MLTIKVTGVFSHPSCFFCLSNLWKQQIQFSIVASERATYGRIAEKCDRIVNCNWESSRVNNKKVRLSYFAFFFTDWQRAFYCYFHSFVRKCESVTLTGFYTFWVKEKNEGGKVIFRDFVICAVEVSAKKVKAAFEDKDQRFMVGPSLSIHYVELHFGMWSRKSFLSSKRHFS